MNHAPPAIAIVANSCPPYRLHVHRRIVREVPQVKLHSIFTHESSNSAWAYDPPAEIGPVLFGQGERAQDQGRADLAWREWEKGGQIIQWMCKHQIQAVIVLGYSDLGRVRIIRWCARNSVPVFLWGDSNIRADQALGFRGVIKKLLLTGIIDMCDGVMSCGSLGMSYFKKYGASDERIFVMPYEPDYGLIRQVDNESIELACRKFGLSRDRRRIVYSGRLAPTKRIDLLIDAFAKIAPQRPNWDLLMIGDGDERGRLEARVPLDLNHRITWTGFIDDQKTISALYRACDVLALPSDIEPWAVVINEAAAAGLAIVASDVVGAAAELVRDGVNGRIFPRGDTARLASCLEDTTDPERIDAMKSASADVLEDWRRRGDPIEGFRKALQSVNVIE